FKDGKADKSGYMKFKIKGVDGPDDYAMMDEVLRRRYANGGGDRGLPDMILMDGGKGQLAIALKVAKELGLQGVALRALAKEREMISLKGKVIKGERVFLPGVKDPIYLKEGSAGDLLLRRIRDEVHRFAITYHRKLRGKKIGSVLEDIPGVGTVKRKALFERFKSLDEIKGSSISDLMEVKGITRVIAERIIEKLTAI
ncbi:MAG: excinuclease ABC subunit C, partial [Deltaproteobacteria bacterium]|nr:excinuclease ABC subunit C [Deltaproteobacteria bacterium]